jgi:RNA polymerase sigma-70 factor (ECF subfamily)
MANSELEFQKIYHSFQPRIARYLTRLVGEYEADDLTQEVFVKVSQALKDFRGESQLSTWIYRIATNAALDRRRRPSFQQMAEKRSHSEPAGEGEEDSDDRATKKGPSVEQKLIRKEMNECIRDFIENLPDNYRAVLVLSELEEVRNTQIAEILGTTLENVKIRLHRARARLKKELETHCSFYRDEQNELACDLKSAFREFRKSP